jgi:hypothetical protein
MEYDRSQGLSERKCTPDLKVGPGKLCMEAHWVAKSSAGGGSLADERVAQVY